MQTLQWGRRAFPGRRNNNIGTDKINDAAITWLAAHGENLTGYLKKIQLVDEVYQKLLDNVGSVEGEIAWGSEEAELPIEAVEAVMQAAGRR